MLQSLFLLGLTAVYLFIGLALLVRVVVALFQGVVGPKLKIKPAMAERKWKRSWISARKAEAGPYLANANRRPSNPSGIFPKASAAKFGS